MKTRGAVTDNVTDLPMRGKIFVNLLSILNFAFLTHIISDGFDTTGVEKDNLHSTEEFLTIG